MRLCYILSCIEPEEFVIERPPMRSGKHPRGSNPQIEVCRKCMEELIALYNYRYIGRTHP